VIVLDATFDHTGISVQVDVLDWTGESRRAISITAAAEILPLHIEDCAIQAWAMRGLGLPEHRFVVALAADGKQAPEATGNNGFDTRFRFEDVTERVQNEVERIDSIVIRARELHASLDEPQAGTGSHCHKSGYACPFMNYCEQR